MSQIIDIVFPSTACNGVEVKKIKEFLNSNNFKANIFLEKQLVVKNKPNFEFPSSKASLRFEQLKKALENPHSKIIWCARGGYGSAELLPFLQTLKKPQNKKIFIGFSDISSLNNFLIQEWQWSPVSAPTLSQIALEKVSKKSITAILNLLQEKTKELKYSLKPLISSTKAIESEVIGGCISVLMATFGSKNQINWQNKILFLEDEGEDGERLDRYFNQIITIAIEQKKYPKAILLGNFLQANPYGTPKAKNINIAIEKLTARIKENKLEIPVFEEKTKCLGHSKNMMPLILGKKAIISDGFLIQKI
jgi:muramoyltetrapeptide carboxypeptidase LdcA involved in peptidoglycan recycling